MGKRGGRGSGYHVQHPPSLGISSILTGSHALEVRKPENRRSYLNGSIRSTWSLRGYHLLFQTKLRKFSRTIVDSRTSLVVTLTCRTRRYRSSDWGEGVAASASSSSKHPPVTPPSVSDVRSVVPPCCVGWLPGCPLACVGNFSHRRCSEVLSPPPLKPSSILSSPSAVPKVPSLKLVHLLPLFWMFRSPKVVHLQFLSRKSRTGGWVSCACSVKGWFTCFGLGGTSGCQGNCEEGSSGHSQGTGT